MKKRYALIFFSFFNFFSIIKITAQQVQDSCWYNDAYRDLDLNDSVPYIVLWCADKSSIYFDTRIEKKNLLQNNLIRENMFNNIFKYYDSTYNKKIKVDSLIITPSKPIFNSVFSRIFIENLHRLIKGAELDIKTNKDYFSFNDWYDIDPSDRISFIFKFDIPNSNIIKLTPYAINYSKNNENYYIEIGKIDYIYKIKKLSKVMESVFSESVQLTLIEYADSLNENQKK